MTRTPTARIDDAFEQRQAELDSRDAWLGAGCPEPDEADIPNDVKAMTLAPMAIAIAFRAQRELAALTHGDYSGDTRTSTIDEFRRAFADAVAEAQTGVSAAEASLTSRYSRSQLSDRQTARATRYRIAYRTVLATIPIDMGGALSFFEVACGVRRAVVAMTDRELAELVA